MTQITTLNPCSQDPRDALDAAQSLVVRSLLQVRKGKYLVHDLLLDFAKNRIMPFREIKESTIIRQGQYLGRLDVLEAYRSSAREVSGSFYTLMTLWRSLEVLSGFRDMDVATYNSSLDALGQSEESLDMARSFDSVADFFRIQVDRLLSRKFTISLIIRSNPRQSCVSQEIGGWAPPYSQMLCKSPSAGRTENE